MLTGQAPGVSSWPGPRLEWPGYQPVAGPDDRTQLGLDSDRPLLTMVTHLPEHPLVAAREYEDLDQSFLLLRTDPFPEPLHLLLEPLCRTPELLGGVECDPVGVPLVLGRCIGLRQMLSDVGIAPGAGEESRGQIGEIAIRRATYDEVVVRARCPQHSEFL